MLRIVHIVLNKIVPGQLSGVHRLVYALAEAESRQGLQVSVWDIGSEIMAGDIDEVVHKSFEVSANRLVLSPAMKSALDELDDASVIHLHGGFVPEYFAVARHIRKSRKRIRLVFSPHGDYNELKLRNLSPFMRAYYYLFERPVIRQASLVHLIGPAEVSGYNFFIEKTTPFVCLPNGIVNGAGVHTDSHRPAEDNFVFTYSGELSIFAKGLDMLMECFATLSKNVPNSVQLWLIGRGKDQESLRSIAARLGIADRVKFVGDVSRKRREELFRQTNIFVHPGRSESLAIHALEAAAVGVPMIVSEETNLATYVRQYEAGWYLARNNGGYLLQAMHEAYELFNTDKSRFEGLQQRSILMIREELNWNTLARKWKEVYSGVV